MDSVALETIVKATEEILEPDFSWCFVPAGGVTIADFTEFGGSAGGYRVLDAFAIAKYPITNGQYRQFIEDETGHRNSFWWAYSPQGAQYWHNRSRPKPTAFAGAHLPRTRASWFDSMAFCGWLSNKLQSRFPRLYKGHFNIANVASWLVCLPTEEEWQRAAVGDTGWSYPWGNELDETKANYGNHVEQVTAVSQFAAGTSPCGAVDMVGNLWEWCLSRWGDDSIDVGGYTYRATKGGAWNVSNPEHLKATDRSPQAPRGRLNDAGFRCVLRL